MVFALFVASCQTISLVILTRVTAMSTCLTVATRNSHAMVDENTEAACVQLALPTGRADAEYRYEHQVPKIPCAR